MAFGFWLLAFGFWQKLKKSVRLEILSAINILTILISDTFFADSSQVISASIFSTTKPPISNIKPNIKKLNAFLCLDNS
ncbi:MULTISPECIES: hypothetical protein [unclassified Polaribacter]|uniref:hypothetical protein n=1 Tax=unclassified Polaribacter TaxID=196858 RepID=UPI0011BEA93C|nr:MULTISPECIES: hypothetical protein [unclassified Polaribacter]TXD53631.1 hypothetical protein ES043_03135 [Polaribacter sp. IC063]TXD62129.1 hypothetical protein ES044_02570 [Polaribacter sp. IC066]